MSDKKSIVVKVEWDDEKHYDAKDIEDELLCANGYQCRKFTVTEIPPSPHDVVKMAGDKWRDGFPPGNIGTGWMSLIDFLSDKIQPLLDSAYQRGRDEKKLKVREHICKDEYQEGYDEGYDTGWKDACAKGN